MLAIQSLIQDFFGVLFPEYCVACHQGLVKGEVQICTTCQHELPQTDYHLDFDNALFQKLFSKVPIKKAFAYWYFQKHSRVQRVLHALKYEGNQEVGYLVAYWYGTLLKETTSLAQELDYIIPIPLHPAKLRKRGFNQSDSIAKGLSDAMGVPWSNKILIRTKHTQSQTRKTKMERWENVEGIFKSSDSSLIAQKRILVVDDVVTTGSTFESAIIDLLKDGAKEVSIAAIAVTK